MSPTIFIAGGVPQTFHQCDFTEGIGSTGAGKALNLVKLNWVCRHTEAEPDALFLVMQKADYVVINIDAFCLPLLSLAQSMGNTLWTDLHDVDPSNPYYESFIAACDIIFFSDVGLKDSDRLMQKWIDQGKDIVVCTQAQQGAKAWHKNGDKIHVPIQSSYQYQNSNGAGDDAFFSGFLKASAEHYDLHSCMTIASHVAGLCIEDNALVHPNLSWQDITRRL